MVGTPVDGRGRRAGGRRWGKYFPVVGDLRPY